MDSSADSCEYLRDCLAVYVVADEMHSSIVDQRYEHVLIEIMPLIFIPAAVDS